MHSILLVLALLGHTHPPSLHADSVAANSGTAVSPRQLLFELEASSPAQVPLEKIAKLRLLFHDPETTDSEIYRLLRVVRATSPLHEYLLTLSELREVRAFQGLAWEVLTYDVQPVMDAHAMYDTDVELARLNALTNMIDHESDELRLLWLERVLPYLPLGRAEQFLKGGFQRLVPSRADVPEIERWRQLGARLRDAAPRS